MSLKGKLFDAEELVMSKRTVAEEILAKIEELGESMSPLPEEEEVEVEIAPPEPAPEPKAPEPKEVVCKGGESDGWTYTEKAFSEVFKYDPTEFGIPDHPVKIWDNEDYVAEEPVPYIVAKQTIAEISFSYFQRLITNIIGPTGCGKNCDLEYFSYVTKTPYTRIEMNEEIDQSKVFGKIDLVGGETVFSPGLFPKRMVIPGIIDIDEASRAPAFALIMFQRPFDRREFVPYESKDAEVIKAHPWNCIFLSDNTAGNGDDIDQYVASNVLDASTINRIQLFIKKDYMGRRDERRIIKKFSPDMSTDEVTALAKFSYLMHTGFKKGDIQSAFSPRNLKTICGAYNDGMSLQVAVTYNFINRLNKSETADVQESFRACFATEVTGE